MDPLMPAEWSPVVSCLALPSLATHCGPCGSFPKSSRAPSVNSRLAISLAICLSCFHSSRLSGVETVAGLCGGDRWAGHSSYLSGGRQPFHSPLVSPFPSALQTLPVLYYTSQTSDPTAFPLVLRGKSQLFFTEKMRMSDSNTPKHPSSPSLGQFLPTPARLLACVPLLRDISRQVSSLPKAFLSGLLILPSPPKLF